MLQDSIFYLSLLLLSLQDSHPRMGILRLSTQLPWLLMSGHPPGSAYLAGSSETSHSRTPAALAGHDLIHLSSSLDRLVSETTHPCNPAALADHEFPHLKVTI